MLQDEVVQLMAGVVCDDVADDGNPTTAWWDALERKLRALGASGAGRDVSFKRPLGRHQLTYDTQEKMNRLSQGPWERTTLIVWVAGEEVRITWLSHPGESPPGAFAVSPIAH